MALILDSALAMPLHRQLYGALRAAILAGELAPGERLPSSRALAGELNVSRTTIAEAYDQLRAEGYIEGRHGSGTYVSQLSAVSSQLSVVSTRDARFTTQNSKLKTQNSTRIANSERRIAMSPFGTRVAGAAYAALVRPAEEVKYRYDLRPHRVARDRFPWDAWRTAVERALTVDRARLTAYPPSAGHPELRRAIAEHVRRYRAVRCSPEQVVVVNGTQQGLNLLAELFLSPGDRVAIEDPGYPTARLTFAARGQPIARVPVDREGMVVDRLRAAGPHRMVHVTPSHQDPTGATLSLRRRLALLEVAEETGCLVVEDDYDSEFRFEGRPVESLQGLDRNGLVVYAGTFSKSILPGLRAGYLILPPALVDVCVAAKTLWDGGAPVLEQAALAQFMVSGELERHIRRMRRLYRRRRDALVTALHGVFGAGVVIGERHGGLNVLVSFDLPGSDTELARRAARASIGLRPASPYYARPPARPTFLMGFAELTEEDLEQGVRSLAAAWS